MSTSANLPDDKILYFLLNKIKHNEGKQEVSFFAEDFEEREVNRDELLKHLEHLVKSGYIKAEIERDANANQGSDPSFPLVTCKQAEITTEGRNALRVKYFKV